MTVSTGRAARRLLAVALSVGLTAGCLASGTTTPAATTPAATSTASRPFPAHGRFDYQLGGAYPPPPGTAIVARDSTDPPAPGTFSICYLNAFQTQPGQGSSWDRGLLLHDRSGRPLVDPDWPDEFILDTTTEADRQAIASRLEVLIDSCATRGFDAIEPDNLDTYARSYVRRHAERAPTRDDNVALLALLADRAHQRGLLIAQKNAGEDSATIRRKAGTDFAIAEECQRYDECQASTDVYGPNLIEIEYDDYDEVSPAAVFEAACAERGGTASVILRDRDVVTPDRSGYRYELCPDG